MVPAVAESRFRVMGSDAHLVVVGDRHDADPGHLLTRAEDRLHRLEARWSRFRDDSELSVVNRAAGAPCVVSGDTATLVATLVEAWVRTGGRFDPTVHDAVVAAGYDRPFDELAALPPLPAAPGAVAPGCGGVDCDAARGLVQLPAGVHLDPGGLGKGLAADLVVADLRTGGATGALVNVGGDLRVAGTPPVGDDWIVAVEGPAASDPDVARVALVEGAVATTTSARRCWPTADGSPAHHVIDPTIGRPAAVARRQATVVAGAAWWAEVLATVAFLDGRLVDPAAAALVIDADGGRTTMGDPAWFALLGAPADVAEEALT